MSSFSLFKKRLDRGDHGQSSLILVPCRGASARTGLLGLRGVIDNDSALFLEGMRLKEKWRLSSWDALVLVAAKKAKASQLWSENLNSGQDYDGLVVVNPFREK